MTPTTMIRVGDDLYVRSWKGRTSWWFRGVQERQESHIEADGGGKDVRFVAEPDPMVAALARDTTITLVPRRRQ